MYARILKVIETTTTIKSVINQSIIFIIILINKMAF